MAVALVTGASRGIGYHVARGLAEAGWDVACVARDANRLRDLTDSLLAHGHRALALAMDVADERGAPEVVDRVTKELGPIELLVNAAGVIEDAAPVWDVDVDAWWQVICTNLRGTFLYTRAVTRLMVAGGGGRVVNLTSGFAYNDTADYTAYAASKRALSAITTGVTLAGAQHGVLAFDLAPGVVRTEMSERMPMHASRTEWTDVRDVVELVVSIGAGELDAWAGRLVRAGSDTPASLRHTSSDLAPGDRQLRLRPVGPDDPVACG